ncbi:MAG: TldD/PmbA family protein, partial [Synergistota bacterium]|nr:TldD/PmbA family protein [Synergistota bacterium]
MSINAKLGDVLKTVVQSGADFADIYFEISASHSYSFESGAMEEISSSSSEGAGARIIRGEETSHAHSPGVNLSSGFLCLRDAALGSGLALEDRRFPSIRVMEPESRFSPPEHSFFHEINRRLQDSSIWIRQISMSLNTASKRFNVFNSEGVVAGDERRYTIFSAEVVVEKNGVMQTGYESEAYSVDSVEFFKSSSPLKIAETALARALMMLDAPMCPAGMMPVLLSGEAGGTMIHEACGHGFEADIIQKEFSVYRDKIGKTVASPLISLIDDGTIPGYLGSGVCDDEGTPCRRNVLIENGVAKAYISDVTTSRRSGIPLTGNGRRSSYRATPQPRMTNTFISPGKS